MVRTQSVAEASCRCLCPGVAGASCRHTYSGRSQDQQREPGLTAGALTAGALTALVPLTVSVRSCGFGVSPQAVHSSKMCWELG